MANNHEQFIAFNKTINSNKRATLKKNRDALRERIKNYFSREYPDEIQPKFHWQGSYAMHTILNPLKDENNLGGGMTLMMVFILLENQRMNVIVHNGIMIVYMKR